MSWEEVKKINGDMSLSLDEKMTYVYGLIPRGAVKKELVYENVGNMTMVNVSGRGMLEFLYIYGNSSSEHTINVTAYLDESLSSKKVITLQNVVSYGAGRAISMNTNLDSIGILENQAFSHDSSNIIITKNSATNIPILFSKSLRVVISGSNGRDNVTVKYYLFP